PLKVNFKKKELKAFGYTNSDKFKILMPCRNTDGYLEHLKTEHLIYEIYSLIDSFGLQSKLTRIIIEDVKRDPKEYTGMILEHKDHFSERMDVKHVEVGILRSAAFDAEDYIRFCLFQYLIANPDWEITQRHNLVAIKKKDKAKLSMVPYDFDYCGLIHTDYAVPHESLPIEEVTQRYFMDKKIKLEQVKTVLPEFLSNRDKVIQHVTDVDYISEKTRKKVLSFLNKSFDILENEKRLKRNLGLRD
ncbi:MAG: hypothetical protein KJO29_01295, partial [Bacteroidia bacterium]|nr:hypothetical protein [Bacteroidia bacterium]